MKRPSCLIAIALGLAMALAGAAWPQEKAEPPGPLFPDARPLTVQTLGAPIRTMPLAPDTWTPNPDGKGWTRLLFYNYEHFPTKLPCQAVAINTTTGEVKKLIMENARGAPWRFTTGADGKCYMGISGPADVWIYDPAAMTITVVPTGIQEAATVSAIATGTDGKIFGSTTRNIVTFQLDPATRKIMSYGLQGSPRKYMPYGYTIAADGDYVYTAAGKIPWELVACNRKTGDQSILLTAPEADYLSVIQGRFGCTAKLAHESGPRKGQVESYWLWQGKLIPQTGKDGPPPWPVPADARETPPPPKPEERLDDAVPGADGKAVYRYRLPQTKPAATEESNESTDPGWKSVTYDIAVGSEKISYVRETPDGRILGVGPAYLDWFVFDPKDDRMTVLGKIPLSHYDTVFAGTKAYMAGYPNTPLYEYDLTKPWTPGKGTEQQPAPKLDAPESNPRRLAYFGSIIETHHGRFVALGADGRIYVAAHAERAHVGGGLGWWDPATQKAGGLREPFRHFDVAGLCAVDEARWIVCSSACVADPATREKPDAARLFVFDTQNQALIATFAPFPGRVSSGRVAPGGGTTVVGFITGPPSNLLYRADVAAREILKQVELPAKLGGDFRLGPDGRIWSFAGNVLVRIDPDTLALSPVGSVAPGRIAFVNADLYLAGETELRRVANVLGGQ